MASKTIKGLSIEIGGDTTKLGQALKSAEDASKKASKEIGEINAALKLVPDSAELLIQKQDALTKEISATSEKLDVLRDAEKQVQAQFDKGEITQEQFKAFQREIIVTQNRLEGYQNAAKETADRLQEIAKTSGQAEDKTDELGETAKQTANDVEALGEEAGKGAKHVDDLGDNADTAGDKFSAASVAVGEFIGNLALDVLREAVSLLKDIGQDILDTGMAFESSMSQVEAVSGANAEEMEKLTAKAREMGATTKFSASEAADAMNYMAMAGWETEDMIDGIGGVLSLAAASNEDLATTSDIVTDALTAFGEGARKAGHLADIMAAASSNANTNVSMMGETFKYAASLAGSMGYTMEDTAIATGLMANSGIKATQAGTSLRAIMTRMAAPTKDSKTAMDALGISLDDGKGNMKSLMEIMQELRGSFGTLKISQDEFEDGMNRLDLALESGELSEEEFSAAQDELIQKAYGAEGAMKAQYASMLAGKNGLSGFLAIVNASDADFDKLTNAVYNCKDAAQSMADTMIDNLAGDLQIVNSAWQEFELTVYDSANTPLRDLTQMLSGEVLPALTDLVTGADGAEERLGEALGNLLTTALEKLTDALPTLAKIGWQIVTTLLTSLLDMSPDILTMLFDIADLLVKGLMTALPDIAQKLAEAVTKNAGILAERLPQLIEILCMGLANAAPQVAQAALTLLTGLVQAIPVLIENLVQVLPEIITAIVTALVAAAPALQQAGFELLLAILDAIPQIIEALTPLVPTIVLSLIDLLLEHADELGEGALEMLMTMAQMLLLVGDKLAGILETILLSFLQSIVDFAPKLHDRITRIIDRLLSRFRDLTGDLRQAGHNIMAGLLEGVTGMADMLRAKATEIANNILQAITAPFQIHSPSRKMAWVGRMIDEGLAEGMESHSDDPLSAMEDMASRLLVETAPLPAQIEGQSSTPEPGLSYTTDPALLARLDRILRAIEDGHVIALDGDKFVGETIDRIDTALGELQADAART